MSPRLAAPALLLATTILLSAAPASTGQVPCVGGAEGCVAFAATGLLDGAYQTSSGWISCPHVPIQLAFVLVGEDFAYDQENGPDATGDPWCLAQMPLMSGTFSNRAPPLSDCGTLVLWQPDTLVVDGSTYTITNEYPTCLYPPGTIQQTTVLTLRDGEMGFWQEFTQSSGATRWVVWHAEGTLLREG